MISSIGINRNLYKKYLPTNDKIAKIKNEGDFTNSKIYNPEFYPIIPDQISFGAANSKVIEKLKKQKLDLVLKNTNMGKLLKGLKDQNDDAMMVVLKALGMDIDNMDYSAIPQTLSVGKIRIRKMINENLDEIFFLDDKIQNKSKKYYDGLDMWKTVLDKEVAGFSRVKENLLNQYLKPVLDEKKGIHARVPSGVVLYGHEGMMKEDFVLSLSQQAGADIEFIEPTAANFISVIELILKNAKKVHQEDNIRTIICVNKFDELADTNPNNQNIVDYLKTRLDNCSKLPDEHNEGYASTFFFMASDPTKIHKDFRREKIGDFIGINPIDRDYIKDIFKFKLNHFKIDANALDYETLTSIAQPDELKGAFSSKSLNEIFDEAFNSGVEDKRYPLECYLKNILINSERDISPEEYKKFKTLQNKLEMPIRTQEEVDRLKKEMGIQD